MYCKNCGKILNQEEKFCSNCGLKIENEKIINPINNYSRQQDIDKKEENKFILSFSMYIVNIFLYFIFILISLINVANNSDGSVGGWAIILMPFIMSIYMIPQVLGVIIELINIFKKKYFLSIISFITSCFCPVSIISYMREFKTNSAICYICLIQSCALIIICFLKLLNNKK